MGDWPQQGRRRIILTAPVGRIGTDIPDIEPALAQAMDDDAVMMMGDNPALPQMPPRPRLLDFFRLRFGEITFRHLLNSATLAREAGHSDTVIMACLLHDLSNGALIRSDHGYWSAQLVAPYVSEEVAWAVRYHQALRFLPDETVGYGYPQAYRRYFGEDYRIPDYLRRDAIHARSHKWYTTSRIITINDVYAFDNLDFIDPEQFADVIGRNFREPEEGLGFDNSPVAHMWRTMIWPNNFL